MPKQRQKHHETTVGKDFNGIQTMTKKPVRSASPAKPTKAVEKAPPASKRTATQSPKSLPQKTSNAERVGKRDAGIAVRQETSLPSPTASADVLVSALRAQEIEIARLHAIILDLREQQVLWLQNQIASGPRPDVAIYNRIPQTSQLSQTVNRREVERMQEALQNAWNELATKQNYLQAAMDDCQKAQAEQQQTQAQLDIVSKRLSVALDVIARNSYA